MPYMPCDIYVTHSTDIYASYMSNAVYVTYTGHIYAYIHAHINAQYK